MYKIAAKFFFSFLANFALRGRNFLVLVFLTPFNGLFSQSPKIQCPNFLNFWNPLGKINVKKWSQIWKLLLLFVLFSFILYCKLFIMTVTWSPSVEAILCIFAVALFRSCLAVQSFLQVFSTPLYCISWLDISQLLFISRNVFSPRASTEIFPGRSTNSCTAIYIFAFLSKMVNFQQK